MHQPDCPSCLSGIFETCFLQGEASWPEEPKACWRARGREKQIESVAQNSPSGSLFAKIKHLMANHRPAGPGLVSIASGEPRS